MDKEQKLLQRRDFLKVASSAGVAGTLMGANIFSTHPDVLAQSETSADLITKGSLAVFTIGAKSSLWSVAENHSYPRVESWHSVSSAQVTAPLQIATGNFANGRLGLFAIDIHNHLWYNTESQLTPGVLQGWQRSRNITSDYSTQIAVGNFSDGRLGLFAIGLDGHLWYITEHTSQPETLGTWQRGGNKFGDYSTQIAVGKFANGQLGLFALDTNSNLWYITEKADRPGTLGTWQRGGNVANDYSMQIAVGNFVNGQLGLFAIGSHHHLWYITESASAPSSLGYWQRGGNVANDYSTQIVVGNFLNSQLGLFAIGSGNHLWYITEKEGQPGTLGTWQHDGNVANDYSIQLATGNFADGYLGLFAIGTDGHLWYVVEDTSKPGLLGTRQRSNNLPNNHSTQLIVGNYAKIGYRKQRF